MNWSNAEERGRRAVPGKKKRKLTAGYGVQNHHTTPTKTQGVEKTIARAKIAWKDCLRTGWEYIQFLNVARMAWHREKLGLSHICRSKELSRGQSRERYAETFVMTLWCRLYSCAERVQAQREQWHREQYRMGKGVSRPTVGTIQMLVAKSSCGTGHLC